MIIMKLLFALLVPLLLTFSTTEQSARKLLMEKSTANATQPTLPFFGRISMDDGVLRAFEAPSSANLQDVYQAIEESVAHIVSLRFNGETLPNDEETLVADAGICAECVIDVLPAKDLQILDRAIKHSSVYLWAFLLERQLKTEDERTRRALDDVDSYASFETAARILGKTVMQLAEECFGDKFIKIKQGKIVSIDVTSFDELLFELCLDLNILSQLTQLSNLGIRGGTDLSALDKLKQLKFVSLYFVRFSPGKRVIIPDMSECAQLEKIEVANGDGYHQLVVDCTGANVAKSMFRWFENTQMVWE